MFTLPSLPSLFRYLALFCLVAVLAACSSTKSGSDGQYRVQRGDTLTKIARQHGQTVAELMRVNNISNPNRIRVGQMLRVKGGKAASGGAVAAGGAGSTTALPAAQASTASVAAPRSINLVWPATGASRRGVSASHSQGVYISGSAGSPVKAAAAGKVIYSGNSLRGYGNMLIVNHDANFLSVYAHNRKLLVSEGQSVRQGQNIAEMGDTDSSAVQLYFELRYNGKPVDALRYLPKK